MRRYEEGLASYTYLADDDAEFGPGDSFSPTTAQTFTLPTPPSEIVDSHVPPN